LQIHILLFALLAGIGVGIGVGEGEGGNFKRRRGGGFFKQLQI